MTDPKSTYHHGSLRDSLLETAVHLLEDEGLDALSTRRLAERLGVSRSAPYHHFRDKHELLCAMAELGFKLQNERLTALDGFTGQARMTYFVRTYVRFSMQHPELYNLMYGREIWKSAGATASLEQIAKQSFKRWLAEVSDLQAQGVLAADVPSVRVAQISWAALHGLCRLINDGIYVHDEDIESMEAALVAMLVS